MHRRYAIVIPARNEEAYIEKCVLSCLQQDYPEKWVDIFVADGMSTDRTTELVQALTLRYPRIQLLENRQQTTPHGLNMGIRAAQADVIIILGGHAALHPDYINQCEAAFARDEQLGCVGGVLENIYETPDSKAIGAAMSSPFGVGSAHFRTGNYEGYTDTVAFGAYKREVFEKVGFFDEELVRNQDDEFNFRISRAGYKIWLSPYIRANYLVRTGFTKLWKQYYQYGYWKVFVNLKHKTITTVRQLIPAFFVAFILLLPLLGYWLWNFYIVAFCAYFAASGWFALQCSRGVSSWKVMKAFFYMHFSYGLGYWEGIIVFLLLKKKPSNKHIQLSR